MSKVSKGQVPSAIDSFHFKGTILEMWKYEDTDFTYIGICTDADETHLVNLIGLAEFKAHHGQWGKLNMGVVII